MSCLSEYRSELVHDTALHTYLVMVCALTEACELEFIDSKVKKLVECKCECALECC